MTGYCQCGCGERTKIAPKTCSRTGAVKGEPLRYIVGHNRRGHGIPLMESFEVRDLGYASPCWVWTRYVHPWGYGQVNVNRKARLAHVAVYEQLVGPVPEGLTLDHLCRNRACVNPVHMEPVTKRENIRRGCRVKLNPDAVREIRRDTTTSIAGLAERYGVSVHTIRHLRKSNPPIWKDVAASEREAA